MENTAKVCVICSDIYYGYGHNARPLSEGKCCDKCNNLVIEERISRLYSDELAKELMNKYCNDEGEDGN
jgi:hypothetical protein